jgi:hypothetical protein
VVSELLLVFGPLQLRKSRTEFQNIIWNFALIGL